jgi:glycosyltransferase involved in cell wall biosynthesis
MNGTIMFYSPIKPPDIQAASGVQRVAALYRQALELAGFHVVTPALPMTYDGAGDMQRQGVLREQALRAGEALIESLRRDGVRPAAWFTYHCYYKSPDVIGPVAAKTLDCRYVIAEASVAQKRANGAWSEHHNAAVEAICAANVVLSSTARDRHGLERLSGRKRVVVDCPPFIDCQPFIDARREDHDRVNIVTAGSMNDPRKIESYRRLMAALLQLKPGSATWTVAGDGAGRKGIERAAEDVAAHGIPVTFLGQLAHVDMPSFFASGDLFAWPGVGEAYGLTYLEAQASGLPVVAEDHAGVSACVKHGTSGLLTDPNDENAFAFALASLVQTVRLRRDLGESARRWVLAERSLSSAANMLKRLLMEPPP